MCPSEASHKSGNAIEPAEIMSQQTLNWIGVGCRAALERPLSGADPPLDAGSAAIRSGADTPDAMLDRRVMTQSGHFRWGR